MSNPFRALSDYELRHLVTHLVEGERGADLHRLLQLETDKGRNAWYEIKEQRGEVADFISDIERTRKYVRLEHSVSAATSFYPQIGLELKYILIHSSINSLAQSLPPKLLAAVVRKRLWKPEKALAYARSIPEVSQRCEALFNLLVFLPETEQQVVFHQALDAYQKIEEERLWAADYLYLYAVTPAAYQSKFLKTILQKAAEPGNTRNGDSILKRFGPELREEHYIDALQLAMNMESFGAKEFALRSLGNYLPTALLEEVYPLGHQKFLDTDWLAGLAPHVSKPILRRAVLRIGEFGRAGNASERYRSSNTIASLIPHLPDDLRLEALSLVKTFDDPEIQSDWLVYLTSYLSDKQLEYAIELAGEISNKEVEGRLKAQLTSLRERKIKYAKKKGKTPLISQSSPLEKSLEEWKRELREVAAIDSERDKEKKLIWYINKVPVALIPEIVAIYESDPKIKNLNVLEHLIPRLEEPARRDLLAEVPDLIPETNNPFFPFNNALNQLAPYFNTTELEKVLSVVVRIGDQGDVLKSQLHFIPGLPPEQRWPMWSGYIKRLGSVEKENISSIIQCLVQALTSLTLSLQKEATSLLAAEIRNRKTDLSVLKEFFEWLPEEEQGQVWNILVNKNAVQKHFEKEQLLELTQLSKQLSDERKRKILESLKYHSDKKIRLYAMLALLPSLPENLKEEALQELLALVPKMLKENNVLQEVLPFLPEQYVVQLYKHVAAYKTYRKAHSRAHLLVQMRDYLPESLQEAALTNIRGIKDTATKVVGLSGYMNTKEGAEKKQMGWEILTLIDTLEDDYGKVYLLENLVPSLESDQLDKLLDILASVSLDDRSYALIDIASFLDQNGSTKAFRLLWPLKDEEKISYNFISSLGAVIAKLPEKQRLEARKLVLDKLVDQPMASKEAWDFEILLEELLTSFPELPGPVIEKLYSKGISLRSHNGLIQLLDYLPKAQQPQAWKEMITLAGEIEEASERIKVQGKLITLHKGREVEALILNTLFLCVDEGELETQKAIIQMLLELPAESIKRVWLALTGELPDRKLSRKQLLVSFELWVELIKKLSPQRGIPDTFAAIRDIMKWWE